MILKGDSLLSPNQPSLIGVSKANKEEEQSHASFMHDVGKASKGFWWNWTFTLNLQLLEQMKLIHIYIQGEIRTWK